MGAHESLFMRVLQPFAIVSVIMSCSVVLTVCVFPSMIKGKSFTTIVALLSFCDAFGNWPYALSFVPPTKSPLCQFEGFCNLYFFPVGWILTTCLTKLFRDLVLKRRLKMSLEVILFISFVIPLAVTLSILSTNTYGSLDDEKIQPCSYGGSEYDGYVWHMVTYAGFLYVCLGIMFLFLFEIAVEECRGRINVNTVMYTMLKRILILYPMAMFLCWLPHGVCIAIPQCYYSNSMETVVDVFKIMHGGCVAIIFFTMSSEARLRWYHLFKGIKNLSPASDMPWSSDGTTTETTQSPHGHSQFLPEDAAIAAFLAREHADRPSASITISKLHALSEISANSAFEANL